MRITKQNYATPVSFISGSINEFDIEQAYKNIILENKTELIHEKIVRLNEIKFLNSDTLERKDRLKGVGLLMRNNAQLTNFINEQLLETLTQFVNYFDIRKSEVISIKKDALFVNKNIREDVVNVNKLNLRKKNTFNIFFKFEFNKKIIEIYYNTDTDNLVIKNLLNDSFKEMIVFITSFVLKNISDILYSSSIDNTWDQIRNIKRRKLNREELKLFHIEKKVLFLNNGFMLKETNFDSGSFYENIIEEELKLINLFYREFTTLILRSF